jgi:hypothetical protein
MVAVALLIARFGHCSVVALAAGGVLLDFAVQGHQVLSQQEVYGLRPEARSRINTIYMSTIFLVGAMASAVGRSGLRPGRLDRGHDRRAAAARGSVRAVGHLSPSRDCRRRGSRRRRQQT